MHHHITPPRIGVEHCPVPGTTTVFTDGEYCEIIDEANNQITRADLFMSQPSIHAPSRHIASRWIGVRAEMIQDCARPNTETAKQ